jgi:hypothetical protein
MPNAAGGDNTPRVVYRRAGDWRVNFLEPPIKGTKHLHINKNQKKDWITNLLPSNGRKWGDAIHFFNAQRNRKQSASAVTQKGHFNGTHEIFHSNSEASSGTLTPTCGSNAFGSTSTEMGI